MINFKSRLKKIDKEYLKKKRKMKREVRKELIRKLKDLGFEKNKKE